MIEERDNSASVSMGYQLFITGGIEVSDTSSYTYEVFRSCSRKFHCTKMEINLTKEMKNCQAVCITSQIIIFGKVSGEYATKLFIQC